MWRRTFDENASELGQCLGDRGAAFDTKDIGDAGRVHSVAVDS